MNAKTLMLLSATGMIATGAVVWTTTTPAHGSAPAGPAVAVSDLPKLPIAPPPDHSHFQAGKTLMVEGRLGHAVLPSNTENETFLYVDVTGANVVAKNPAPLALSIVIDRSGSMAGKRLVNALAAARTAIERLRDGDVVNVVTFDTKTDVVVQPTAVSAESRPRMIKALASIRVGGDTCISCGVDTAMNLLGQRDGMVNRILVLSDGQPTAGVRDVEGFRQIAENCRRMGAAVTTIGVDVAYDEKIMSALARSSNGHHFFVADPTGLPSIFDKEMASLTKTVANRAELIVDLAPGVFADHVFDRVTTGDGSQLTVPLGSFSAGDRKTLLVRLRVPRGADGERPIASVRLHYDDLADATKPGNCEGKLAARLSSDATALTTLDPFVSARVSATETAETLEEANGLFRAGRAADARGLIERQQVRLKRSRDAAKAAAPSWQRREVSAKFDANNDRLSGAGSGFNTSPAAAPPAADPAGQAQVRKNQEDAVTATE
ncbi:MAG: VWA domain-containing protein [Kofleriaceae bacterium]